MGVIFDLDQTIIDSRVAGEARRHRYWPEVYGLIPYMTPYDGVVRLINQMVKQGIEVAIVTSAPRPYCEKVLKYLNITGVITVCYHDTQRHKPDPEPYNLAISRMKNQEGKRIVVVGDEVNDIIAADAIGADSILGYWGNYNSFQNMQIQPTVYCKDENSLMSYFICRGVMCEVSGLRRREDNILQLLDYYPKSRRHDMLSERIFEEMKQENNSTRLCDALCREIERTYKDTLRQYGIFVVPSSTANRWNSKLTDYVVPQLVSRMGLVDCSRHILRHITHDKQAFGGDRSMESNLNTIRLQYDLPTGIEGAIIVDDITTSGNIFKSCIKVLCDKGVEKEKIICIALGGTV